jgi:predicted O-methyltransferase YrrM
MGEPVDEMKPEEVRELVGDVPHMTLAKGRTIAAFIGENKIRDILELGFRHGVSTCYMAGALEDTGGGCVTTIDLESAKGNRPSIEQLIKRTGLRGVEWFYEPSSYTWRLMKFLERDPSPRFDLCFIDGAHSWFVDGFAFFLVDRLLRPGGWIILDDLDWTYANSPSLGTSERVKSMPAEERATAQVRKIYELLVKPHPSYTEFRVEDGWGYARKKLEAETCAGNVKREVIVQKLPGPWDRLLKRLRTPRSG